jgi:N-acetylneuraminic acid mutarotase
MTWLQLSSKFESIAVPRMGHSATLLDMEQILIFGGAEPTQAFNDTYIFNANDLTWKKLNVNGEIPRERYDHTANWENKTKIIAIFGGSSPKTIYNDVYILNTGIIVVTCCIFIIRAI